MPSARKALGALAVFLVGTFAVNFAWMAASGGLAGVLATAGVGVNDQALIAAGPIVGIVGGGYLGWRVWD